MKTTDAQAEAAVKKPATPRGRKLYLSVNAPIDAADEPEPGSHLKRIFVLLLLVHVFLVGGIVVYNVLRQQPRPAVAEREDVSDKKPIVARTLATGSSAKVPAATPPAPVAVGAEYTVQVGDTLRGIAEAHGVDEGDLCAVNGISTETKLETGRTIRLPKKGDTAPEKTQKAPAPAPAVVANKTEASKPDTAKPDVKSSKKETTPDAPPGPGKAVVFNAPPSPDTQDHPPGPTKANTEPAGKKIAEKPPEKSVEKTADKSADKSAEKAAAKAKEDAKAKEEAKAKLAKEEAAKADKNAKGRTYTVNSKDTFYSISKKFGVNVNELMKLNNVKDPGKLHEGTKLKIPAKN